MSSKRSSRPTRDLLDLTGVWNDAFGEHRHLECRPMRCVSLHQVRCNGLHDVVDMDWHAARVRPKAVVDLLSGNELVRNR